MKKIKILLVISFGIALPAYSQNNILKVNTDRKSWISYMDKIARPVLTNLSANTLKENPDVKNPFLLLHTHLC